MTPARVATTTAALRQDTHLFVFAGGRPRTRSRLSLSMAMDWFDDIQRWSLAIASTPGLPPGRVSRTNQRAARWPWPHRRRRRQAVEDKLIVGTGDRHRSRGTDCGVRKVRIPAGS